MIDEPSSSTPDSKGRRRRRVLLVAVLLMVAALAGFSLLRERPVEGEAGPAASAEQARKEWFCPMHPHVVADEPGQCPICRMELVERERAAAPAVAKNAEEEPAAAGAGRAAAPPVSLSAQAIQVAGVATVPVLRQDLVHEIRAAGTIEADETRLEHVAARVPGRIERLHADFTGQPVRRGAPLYELYSPDLVATQREYLLALEQQRRLAATGSAEAAESAGALVGAARDRLALWGITDAQIQALERTGRPELSLTFASPISGTILQKNVIEGQYVEEGTDLYLLADLSSVWLVAQVYEFELGKLRIGQPVAASNRAYPGREFGGRIAFIEPVLDQRTRTARVRIVLPNRSGELKPGMFADAKLRIPVDDQLSVPRSAVIDTGTRQVVYVETAPGSFEARAVALGDAAGDRVAVLEGLQEGEKVVAAANFLIDSQAQLASGASLQWSGVLDVKERPTPRDRETAGPPDRK